MPLFMDIHTVDSETLSVEDVVKAHMEDLAIQDKFGVTQLKYWVNEDAKTLFCLMKGPDKESCHQVHKQSHGNTACNIIEVSDNEYNLFMGIGTEVNDLAKTPKGELDTGYRTILQMHFVCLNENRNTYKQNVYSEIKSHNGVLIVEPDDEIMVSFIYARDAILFANKMSEIWDSEKGNFEYTLAISSGRPVDEHGEKMFVETKKNIYSLCGLGLNKLLFLDEETKILAEKELHSQENNTIKFSKINSESMELARSISNVLETNFSDTGFSEKELSAKLGLSKSQAYRKIKALTGLAPNQLISEVRLQKALKPIQKHQKTIAEIAYDYGFNSPTYFTRVFKKRFGLAPTAVA